MKDLFDVELEIGQKVGFTTRGRYNYTYRGKVVGFTPKMVKVKYTPRYGVETVLNLDPQNLVISVDN